MNERPATARNTIVVDQTGAKTIITIEADHRPLAELCEKVGFIGSDFASHDVIFKGVLPSREAADPTLSLVKEFGMVVYQIAADQFFEPILEKIKSGEKEAEARAELAEILAEMDDDE